MAATVEQVWAVLSDIRLVARCLPGAELTEDLATTATGPGRRVAGPDPAQVRRPGTGRDAKRGRSSDAVLAQGTDASSQTTADIRLTVTPANGGALLGRRPNCT